MAVLEGPAPMLAKRQSTMCAAVTPDVQTPVGYAHPSERCHVRRLRIHNGRLRPEQEPCKRACTKPIKLCKLASLHNELYGVCRQLSILVGAVGPVL